MKMLLLLPLAVLVSMPLHADEPKAQETASAAAEPAPADSPLVSAAKRANRLGKKKPANVITNESVKRSKGHITTTTVQHSVDVPKPQMAPSEAAALKKRQADREAARVRLTAEAKAREQEEAALAKRARAAAIAEEGYYENPDDDPARAEQDAEQATAGETTPATTTSEQKPPRS